MKLQDVPVKQNKRWSHDDDETLRKMVRAGRDSVQISQHLGRTRASVSWRKSIIGVKESMTPAYGSKVPYVAFTRDRTKQPELPFSVEPHAVAEPMGFEKPDWTPRKEIITGPDNDIADQIKNLVNAGKSRGLSIAVVIGPEVVS